jgi:protease-4
MKDFLKFTFASLVGSIIALALLLTVGVGGLLSLVISIAASAKDSGPKVEDKTVLVLDLGTTIQDAKVTSTTSEALEEVLSGDEAATLALRNVIRAIEKAAEDERIIGLLIEGSKVPGATGLANLEEVRAALERFRDSGKEIIAYDTDWTEAEYYLASVANQIVVNPLGSLEFNGFSSEVMFLTGALEKFGIGVQVTRVGKYKSAVEPFLREQMSPENRQQLQGLLGDIWSNYLQSVASSRELTVDGLQAIANSQGILIADAALNSKLVDRVAYPDEIIEELKEKTGKDEDDRSFRQINLGTYSQVADVVKASSGKADSKNKIAIVYTEGEIVDGEGSPRQIGGDRLARELRKVRLDDKVKALVLRVNSPGGSVTASEVISREVELIAKEKPVVVSMGNFAASGGYWISMNADKILAEENTITGSIGVFGILFNVQKLANDNGITWDAVTTSDLANLNTVSRPKTAEELALIQNIVDLIYDRFVKNVAEARQLPEATVKEIAQGRVWSGIDAKNLGLVDDIGGIDDAVKLAAVEAELGDDWKLEEYPKFRSFEEQILERLSGAKLAASTTTENLLIAELEKLQEELAVLGAMNDPKGIYVRLPFNLRID